MVQIGKVLVVGGWDQDAQLLHSAELYDPATESWTPTGGPFHARHFPSANMLRNGRVLFAGGYRDGSCELFAQNGDWFTTGKLNQIQLSIIPQCRSPTGECWSPGDFPHLLETL
jgi:hypothetical protein